MTEKLARKEELGREIMQGLRKEGFVHTLKDKPSGWVFSCANQWSPFRINLGVITSSPSIYKMAGEAMGIALEEAGFSPNGRRRAVGLAVAGIPFSDAVTLNTGLPSFQTNMLPPFIKTPQEMEEYVIQHPHFKLVHGFFTDGDDLALVDDVSVMFNSKILAISQIKRAAKQRSINVNITNGVVLVEMEQGAVEVASSKTGIELSAVISFASKGLDWIREDLTDGEYRAISDYLRNPQQYQSEEARRELGRTVRNGAAEIEEEKTKV